jgi:hypothetical protein
MINYYSHGLNIFSEIKIPELNKSKLNNVNIIIRFLNFENLSDTDYREVYLTKLTKAKISSDGIYVIWKNIKIFFITQSEIIINPKSGLNHSFLRLLLLSYGFAILLYQRNRLVLHANAINMVDGAVAFLGTSGSGKSTTSLALVKKGYKLLADDIVSVETDYKKYANVYPSFPRIKIWPEVLNNIDDEENIEKICLNNNKQYKNVLNNFSSTYKELKAIYIINNGPKTEIKEINKKNALLELIRSSYCFKLFNRTSLSENLKQCSFLVNNVPVKILDLKRSFKDIDLLVKVIENDYYLY